MRPQFYEQTWHIILSGNKVLNELPRSKLRGIKTKKRNAAAGN